MPPPPFDESIKAEKLPLEVLKWMNDAATYARRTPGSAEEVFSELKLALRLLAVRNPDSQSHATRKTFGLLIESIYEQPGSETVCNELLDLLVRIIDARQSFRYNPMKHLAISGLGHLAVFLSRNMRQMAANVFIICIEAVKIAPVMPQTLWYRNTILWTLTQAAATTVDEKSISQAYHIAKGVIESSASSANYDAESRIRAFRLLAALVVLPQAKFAAKHASSIAQLNQDYNLLAPPGRGHEEIALAAAHFYGAYLIATSAAKPEIIKMAANYDKAFQASLLPKASKRAPWRVAGYARLLRYLVAHVDASEGHEFMSDLEEVYMPHLLALNHTLARELIVDTLINAKIGSDLAGVDALGILLRQLVLTQSPAPRPHKQKTRDALPRPSLDSTLACLGSIVALLGNAVQPVAASVHQATLGLVLNGNTELSEEQLALIILALQRLGHSVPVLITTTICLGLKHFEITPGSAVNDRRKELAYIIGAMIAQSSQYPLYGDVELNTRVMLLALEHIKQPSDIVAYKSGWLLLQGILTLGSHIIKPMMPQLLALWEGHLRTAVSPPPQIECALTGLVVFLVHNRDLLTADVAARISKSLYALWSESESHAAVPVVRRRLLQCYKLMLDSGKLESYPASLLLKYVAHTTNPSPYSKVTGVVIESAIFTPGSAAAVSAATAAASASGVPVPNASSTSLKYDAGAVLNAASMTGCGFASLTAADPRSALSNDIDNLVFFEKAFLTENAGGNPVDVSTTVVDIALEVVAKLLPLQPERIKESVFDAILTNLENAKASKSLRGHAVIFNIAKLVSLTLHSCRSAASASVATQDVTSDDRDGEIGSNSAIGGDGSASAADADADADAADAAANSGSRSNTGSGSGSAAITAPYGVEGKPVFETRVFSIIVSLIKSILRTPYKDISEFALQSCGLLACSMRADTSGTQTLSSMVKDILDLTVASDVHPIVRGTYILTLGYIAEQWPNIPLLEAMFKVLMPLAAHPDPQIHLPALGSMRRVLMSPEMIDLKYVKCTLKTIGLTMLLDSHNNNAAFRMEVAEDLVLVLSRIGPVLSSESQKQNRSLIVCLADQLQNSSQPSVRVLAWKSFIELYYYSRQGITWAMLIKRWRDIIIEPNSLDEEVDSAVNGLLMLMKLSASTIFSVAGNGLEDALWLLLDRRPRHCDILTLFYTWVDQTAVDDSAISFWLNKLSSVVTKPRFFFANRLKSAIRPKTNSAHIAGNERSASVTPTAIAADEDVTLDVKSEDSTNDQFSWEARAFAIELLLHILRKDVSGKEISEKKDSVTTKRVGDIIKIAFSSATSNILGLQCAGLSLLNEVMIHYGDLADPDFPHISLLEQYQVQILSAITPAFSRDSTPSVAFVALRTCSTFLTSKIVKSKEKLHRLTRILEASITSMSSSDNDSILKLGEIEMTSDSARMLRVAVLSVWAEMENHSSQNEHLQDIVSPWKSKLISLWTESIFDYGRLRSVLDSQWSMTTLDDLVAQMQDAQVHWLMKPIYQITWVSIVEALSAISSEDNEEAAKLQEKISPLVLCGLCFQSLIETLNASGSNGSGNGNNPSVPAAIVDSIGTAGVYTSVPTPVAATSSAISSIGEGEHQLLNRSAAAAGVFQRNNLSVATLPSIHAYRLSILNTLKKTLTPKTSELVITSTDSYFEEIVPILYRVMLIGNPEEQSCVLAIARNLVEGQPETDDSVDHFFEILKIAMQPLRSLLPQVFDPEVAISKTGLDTNQIALLQQTMDTLIDITQVFREIIQNDLWLCLLRIFEELNSHEPAVAAPSFKKLLEILAAQAEQRGITFIIGALTASLKKAVERENTTEALLVCSALTCTNSKILLNPESLLQVQRFGNRAGETLKAVCADNNEGSVKEAEVALQCIAAVMKVCSNTPSGGSFAFGCLPGLVKLGTLDSEDEKLHALRLRSVRALVLYGALDGTLETMSVVVPVLVLHAEFGGDQSGQSQNLLLQLASQQPAIFKETVLRMDEDDKKVLQQLLAKQAMDTEDSELSDDDDDELDGIELKSFV